MTVLKHNILHIEDTSLVFNIKSSKSIFLSRKSLKHNPEMQSKLEKAFLTEYFIKNNLVNVGWFSDRFVDQDFYDSAFGVSISKIYPEIETFFNTHKNIKNNQTFIFSSLSQDKLQQKTTLKILDDLIDQHNFIFDEEDFKRILKQQVKFSTEQNSNYELNPYITLIEKKSTSFSQLKTIHDQTKEHIATLKKYISDGGNYGKNIQSLQAYQPRALLSYTVVKSESANGLQMQEYQYCSKHASLFKPIVLLRDMFRSLESMKFNSKNSIFYFYSKNKDYSNFFRLLNSKFGEKYNIHDPEIYYGHSSLINIAHYISQMEFSKLDHFVLIDIDKYPNFSIKVFKRV